MDSRRSLRSPLRRVAFMAALAALMAPAGVAEAATKKKKQPVITSVSPLNAEIGDVLTIRGRNFRPGKARNTVVFKRDGARAVFVKDDVATRRLIRVTVPERLLAFMANQGVAKLPTRFRLRILAYRFGKSFTRDALSPMLGPDKPPPPPPPPVAAAADGDCDGDGRLNGAETDDDADGLSDDVELSLGLDPCKVDSDADGLEDTWEFDCDRDRALNRDETDDDNDLLSDDLENSIGTGGCSADTDGDGVEDGYEFRSAVDLNDDEYQQPQASLPYPGKRPYANPLFADAGSDYDGDGLSLGEEQALWKYTYEVNRNGTRTLDPLSYSDGLQHSLHRRCAGGDCGAAFHDGRRVPTQRAADYAKWFGSGDSNVCGGSPCNELGFLKWLQQNNYRQVYLAFDGGNDILDTDLDETVQDDELHQFDIDGNGWLSDDERDEDADGLTNHDELHGRATPAYWASCYSSEGEFPIAYAGTSHVDADTDGDGVRDGADDQDHDDVPNVMELSRFAASGLNDTEDSRVGTWGTNGLNECAADQDLPKAPAPHNEGEYGEVNPFSPCLPDPNSRTCPRYVSPGQSYAKGGRARWFSLN